VRRLSLAGAGPLRASPRLLSPLPRREPDGGRLPALARALGARGPGLGGLPRRPAREAPAAYRAARLRSLIAMKITAIEAVPLAIPLRPMNPPSPWTG